MTADTASTQYVRALDGVRGVAILAVMVHHLAQDAGQMQLHVSDWLAKILTVLSYGYGGVDVFFVLSGFLITSILLEQKSHKHYFSFFYARRVLRIFPLYYGVLFLVLALPVASNFPQLCMRYRQYDMYLWCYGTNIIQALTGKWLFGNLMHFWTLAVEEQYYLLCPLVVWLCSRPVLKTICLCGIFLPPILRLVIVQLAQPDPNSACIMATTLTPCHLDGLALGSFIAVCLPDWISSGRSSGYGRLLSVYTVVAAVVFFALHQLQEIPLIVAVGPTLFAVWAFLIIKAIVVTKNPLSGNAIARVFENGFLVFFGVYSYGLYVIHGVIRPPVFPMTEIVAAAGSDDLGWFVHALLFTAACTGLAVLSYKFYESQFLKLKRYFPRHDHAPAVPLPGGLLESDQEGGSGAGTRVDTDAGSAADTGAVDK
jgi:peptidoglycan/LPS O-acetylase OafA/YrhL